MDFFLEKKVLLHPLRGLKIKDPLKNESVLGVNSLESNLKSLCLVKGSH